MHGTHRDHIFPLLYGEKAIIETGYEIRFGDYSSSVTKTDSDYEIIGKISKFSFAPNHHYWLILRDLKHKRLDVVERISYHHITESYGYLYNNDYMDSKSVGDFIPDNTIVQKSLAFDEYNNRQDGINFNVIYMALDDNMEDSIIMSDVAAGKMVSPLVKPIPIAINDNDIPLNIYGDDKNYKIIPDIGEDIKDAILIALRKEKKEEAFYTQSMDRLRKIFMSDELRQAHGKVVDINIYCNNPEILESSYYTQLKMYYNELKRYSKEIVTTIVPFVADGYELSYDLQKLFANAKRVMNNAQYTDKRQFSNIKLEIVVLEELAMNAGDKASNRFGGKGVVSDIWQQKFMPRFKNAKGNYVYADAIMNSSTMYGRENPGQIIELELTHIGCAIIDYIISEHCDIDAAYTMIKRYIELCTETEAKYMEKIGEIYGKEELIALIENIIADEVIHLSMKPISEAMSIDRLAYIYSQFPWITQNDIEVPMVGSDGTVRYVKARRPAIIAKQYMFRLKQFAEEKFSATSLSATNIRNENTKSRVKKDFKELYPNTPIRFGNMESNNMNHAGVDVVINNMMIHSVSPQGRRLVEQMYTDDPFSIDIKLNSDSSNRSAEIANTFLKTIGRRLRFIKKRKKRDRVAISPVTFDRDPFIKPISFVPESEREGFDYEKDFEERQKLAEEKKNKKAISPFLFEGISRKKDGSRKR